jgi:histo-blood group ABO system transferase
MKIALIVIATGEKYWKYADEMILSAEKFMPYHRTFLFTDQTYKDFDFRFFPNPLNIIEHPDLGFPRATLMRYRAIMSQADKLQDYDQIFYSDSDMFLVAPVAWDDICSDGITATLHPGYVVNRYHATWGRTSTTGTPERREQSTAYIPRDANNRYFCGGFNGGSTHAFLTMAAVLTRNIDIDEKNGIMAVWHDESHLNRYLYHNPPTKVLTPSFCYPEGYDGGYGWAPSQFPPVLIACNKGVRK